MRAGGDARPFTMRPMARILVVDDEPKIVRLVRDYLEHGGFEVIVARDGREALMRARAEHPDLVVLDLGLPGLDGLDVTRALRRETRRAADHAHRPRQRDGQGRLAWSWERTTT